jgi:hypothetical protein
VGLCGGHLLLVLQLLLLYPRSRRRPARRLTTPPCPRPQDSTSGSCARARLAACRDRDAACGGVSLGADASPLQAAYLDALSRLGGSTCGAEGFSAALVFEGLPLGELEGGLGNASARAVAALLESVASSAKWAAARVAPAAPRAGRRRALLGDGAGGAPPGISMLVVSVPVADRAAARAAMSKAAADFSQGLYAALRRGGVPFRPRLYAADGALLGTDAPLPAWATRSRAGLDALLAPPRGGKGGAHDAGGANGHRHGEGGWPEGLSRPALAGLVAAIAVVAVGATSLGCAVCLNSQRRLEHVARARRTPRLPRFSDTPINVPPSDLDPASLDDAIAAGKIRALSGGGAAPAKGAATGEAPRSIV